jgi:hypothetical protein
VHIPPGVSALPESLKRLLYERVGTFNCLNENDPHGEHDFGSIKKFADTSFWKIDY